MPAATMTSETEVSEVQIFLQKCAWWLCAGVGFDISQRLLDHWVDIAADRYPLLAWLK